MKENNVAKLLGIIGKAVIVGGIALAFITALVSSFAVDSGFVALISFVAILFVSVIGGALFLGFAEAINLLQLNVFKTEKLIKLTEANKESE